MNIDRVKEVAGELIGELIADEDWDELAGELFVMLARKAADSTETEFDDNAVEYIIRKLGLDE